MKVLIVALVFVVTVAASDWVPKEVDEIRAIRMACRAENPLSEEQVEKMNRYVFPDEEPVRRFLLCFHKKVGIFTEQERYIADRVAKQFTVNLGEAAGIAIAEKCADKKVEKSSADVQAFRGNSCFSGFFVKGVFVQPS